MGRERVRSLEKGAGISPNVIKFSDTGYEETLIMNECIRQRMHFFCKMCMTRKQIEESA